MHGCFKIDIIVRNSKYSLNIRRNLTLIQGLSATGKSTICNYINAYTQKVPGVAIAVISSCSEKASISLLVSQEWETRIKKARNTIFFIDEESKFIYSRDFAKAIQGSSNYYVIISRHGLKIAQLPLSVSEVYELKTSGKFVNAKELVTYTQNTQLWKQFSQLNVNNKISKVIVEDSGTGFSFFEHMCKNAPCVSANGCANILSVLKSELVTGTLVVIDGAAYGAYISDLIAFLIITKPQNCLFYFPESFEWLLLHSIIFDKFKNIREVLVNPYGIVASELYTSWEKYFEHLLKQSCSNVNIAYSKGKELNYNFTSEKNMERLKEVIGISTVL